MDNNNFYNYQQQYGVPDGFDGGYADFNPMAQYEQGYVYYRFLTQQLEYTIKCKEFEKMCNENKNERRVC